MGGAGDAWWGVGGGGGQGVCGQRWTSAQTWAGQARDGGGGGGGGATSYTEFYTEERHDLSYAQAKFNLPV